MRATILAALCGAILALPMAAGAGTGGGAVAALYDAKGAHVGDARFTQTAQGVEIHVRAKDLPPGVHAVHVHESGKCEAQTGFNSAGAHFNPTGKEHGKLSPNGPHAGDMDNQTADAKGVMDIRIVNPHVSLQAGANSLFDADGSALVIHAKADDYTSQPAGNAGDRIACGVIERK